MFLIAGGDCPLDKVVHLKRWCCERLAFQSRVAETLGHSRAANERSPKYPVEENPPSVQEQMG